MLHNADIYEVAKTLKVNDVISFRTLMKNPASDRTESARVVEVSHDEARQQVNITYVPCKLPDSVKCGFGCHFVTPHDDNANKRSEWGWQSLEVLGTEQPAKFPAGPNLYKNPGYDLVNL